MFRSVGSIVAGLVLCACAVGLVVLDIHVSRGALPRAEPETRVASAQMLVFVPAAARGQPSGYLDGRPVPSGLMTPIIVRWRGGEPGNTVVARAASVIP